VNVSKKSNSRQPQSRARKPHSKSTQHRKKLSQAAHSESRNLWAFIGSQTSTKLVIVSLTAVFLLSRLYELASEEFYWRLVCMSGIFTYVFYWLLHRTTLSRRIKYPLVILFIVILLLDYFISPVHIFAWSPIDGWTPGSSGPFPPYQAPEIIYEPKERAIAKYLGPDSLFGMLFC
jgi:hypothetical protein